MVEIFTFEVDFRTGTISSGKKNRVNRGLEESGEHDGEDGRLFLFERFAYLEYNLPSVRFRKAFSMI